MTAPVPDGRERRGEGADWRNPWPPVGVAPGPPTPSAGFDALRADGFAVVVRELHVRYDSEGWTHERYVGGTRVVQQRGKAAILEQALVEREEGRPLAHEWLVQLLVGSDGKVTDWPDWYWEMIAAVEGRPVAVSTDAARTPWGPAAP